MAITLVFYWLEKRSPRVSVKRRIISAWLDALYLSIAVAFFEHVGIIFTGVYLWVIFGNGFRFGLPYLIHSQLVNITGFLIASNYSAYWIDFPSVKYSLLLMLLALPIYVGFLLKILHQEKKASNNASMAKSNFIASISHEIRTPLTGILGISTLLKNPKSHEDNDHLLKILENSTKILISLLNNVLDISKIEENKMVMEYSDFQINDLLINTTEIFEGQSISKNIQLKTSPLLKDVRVEGCYGLIQQVLSNLISNGIKFTSSGTVSVEARLLNENETHTIVRFEISDTGIGMNEKEQIHLFDKFSQTRSSDTRKYGGSGLGLYISSKIISAFDSQLKVSSQEGLGSRFYFDIQFKLTTVDKNSISINYINKDTTINNSPDNVFRFPNKLTNIDEILTVNHRQNYKLKILLCEDDHVNQLVTTRILEIPGHEVHLAKDSDELLDLLDQQKFDVVISDLNIPGKSGIESLKLYRFLNPEDRDTKFIMLSAEATKEAIEESKDAKFDKFLTKPVEINSLYSAIAEVSGLPEEAVANWMRSVVKKNKPTAVPSSVEQHDSNNEKLNVIVLGYEDHSNQILDQGKLVELEFIGKSDPEFMKLVINTYLKDALLMIEDIQTNFNQKQYKAMFNICHELTGISAVIGAELVLKHLGLLEKITEEDLKEKGAPIIRDLHAGYFEVKEEIEQYLQKRLIA